MSCTRSVVYTLCEDDSFLGIEEDNFLAGSTGKTLHENDTFLPFWVSCRIVPTGRKSDARG